MTHLAIFLLISVAIGVIVVAMASLAAAEPPRDSYAFTLPPTLMTCLTYSLHSGETFSNWEIYQPMAFVMSGTTDVTMSHIFYQSGDYCGGVLG